MAAKAGQLCSFRRSSGQQHQTGSTNPSNAFSLFTSTTSNGGKICTSLYLRRCLPEKFYAKQMVLKNVIRTYWGMQKNKVQIRIMYPLGDSSWHKQPLLPNFGGFFGLCCTSPLKGHMIWFCFFAYPNRS